MKSLNAVHRQAKDLVRSIEALMTKKPLDQAVLDELAEGDLSAGQLSARLRRRRGDVFRMVKLLERAKQVRRVGQRWTLGG